MDFAIKPLAYRLLDALSDLLFCPDFTVSTAHKKAAPVRIQLLSCFVVFVGKESIYKERTGCGNMLKSARTML